MLTQQDYLSRSTPKAATAMHGAIVRRLSELEVAFQPAHRRVAPASIYVEVELNLPTCCARHHKDSR
jgi:hypothetical protein